MPSSPARPGLQQAAGQAAPPSAGPSAAGTSLSTSPRPSPTPTTSCGTATRRARLPRTAKPPRPSRYAPRAAAGRRRWPGTTTRSMCPGHGRSGAGSPANGISRRAADLVEDAEFVREHDGYQDATMSQVAMRLGIKRDRLQGGLEICVRRHQDTHFEVAGDRHAHEVDGKRDVDTLFLGFLPSLVRVWPAVRVTKRSHGHVDHWRLPPCRHLAGVRRIASRVAGGVRLAAVDADLVQLAIIGTVGCDELPQCQWVHPRRSLSRAGRRGSSDTARTDPSCVC